MRKTSKPAGGRKTSARPDHRNKRPQGTGRPAAVRTAGHASIHSVPVAARKDFITVPTGGRMVMGDHAIREVFAVHPKSVESVILQERWENSEDLRQLEKLAREKNLKINVRPIATLDRIGSHQGALLIVKDQPEIDLEAFFDRPQEEAITLVALDGVEDPQNLGAILRTCWLMGVKAVIIPEDRAVGLTPVVHKVAAGGVEHVPLIRNNNFASIFDQLKEHGFWTFGLSHKSEGFFYDLKIPQKVVWVLGAEDKGLRTSSERICDELVRLPQVSADASYNVSVATSMVLGETYRQVQLAELRQSKTPGKK